MSFKIKYLNIFFTLFAFFFVNACSESFTDSRDGKNYDIKKISNRIWMIENLNYETAESFCPDGDERNCKKMGRLYTWNAAQSVCPEGWQLPSQEDFKSLLFEAENIKEGNAGYVLKSSSGWHKKGNGSNDLNFTALPAGYRKDDGKFDGIGGYAYFWSSSKTLDDLAYYLLLDFSSKEARINFFIKSEARSVRCLRK